MISMVRIIWIGMVLRTGRVIELDQMHTHMHTHTPIHTHLKVPVIAPLRRRTKDVSEWLMLFLIITTATDTLFGGCVVVYVCWCRSVWCIIVCVLVLAYWFVSVLVC